MFFEPGNNRATKSISIAIDTKDRMMIDAFGQGRPTRTKCIEKHKVGLAQKCGGVVLYLNRKAQVLDSIGLDATRSDTTKVDRHRSATRTPVKCKGHRPIFLRKALLIQANIAHRKHIAHERARIGTHIDMTGSCAIADRLACTRS